MYICTLEIDVVKKEFKEYIIPFVGLKIGKHQFDYEINNAFFELFGFDEFNDVDVKVSLLFEKKPTMLELTFEIDGKVNVDCDTTMESYNEEIFNELRLIVKFGDAYEEVNEELVVLPHGEFQLEVQQFIYEAIVLAMPLKRVHPGVEDGTLDSKILKKLEELTPSLDEERDLEQNNKKENPDQGIDPRWNKLKDLLKDKK